MTELQRPVPFEIPPEALATDPADADRFVYTPTFVHFDPYTREKTAHLPAPQLDRAAFLVSKLKETAPPKAPGKKLIERYRLQKQVDKFSKLQEEFAQITKAEAESLPAAATTGNMGLELAQAEEELRAAIVRGDTSSIGSLVMRIAAKSTVAVASSASTAASEGGYHAASPVTTPGSGGGSGQPSKPPPPPPPGRGMEQALEVLLQSELGLLFLDRTRIRPRGFALGEHLHSLSLGPGEEVTIEERSYSKAEESFERSAEQEKTFDTEMSSTLTTELNEGISSERSRNLTDAKAMGLTIGGEVGGVNFNIGPSASANVAEADRGTVSESVKNSQAASSKVSARNRAQHKTVFRVASETRFEMANKRIVRNPNVTTPIDLKYFKVMQRLELSHERYGLRLCWAPAVADPGRRLHQELERVRSEIYAKVAKAGAGPRPQQPVPQVPAAGSPAQSKVVSQSVIANKFDPLWGGQSHDYQVTITAPTGMAWDRRAGDVENSLSFQFSGSRPASATVRSALPTPTGVLIIVHVGIEDCFNPLKPKFWEKQGTATFTASARFEPEASPTAGTDDSYAKAVHAWREAAAAWEEADRQAKAEAKRAADEEWAAYLEEALRRANPKHETISAIVQALPADDRDELSEVDFWEDLFDWKNAGLRLYPSWWASRGLRHPQGSPHDFINASCARLFLPVKPGAEAQALRWIYDRKISGKGSTATEKLVSTVTKQIEQYRKESFGDVTELQSGRAQDGCPPITQKFTCLGRWQETIPTDGTHLEVMQATSSAADDYSREQLADADRLRDERVKRTQRGSALLEQVEQEGVSDVQTRIDINLGDGPSD